ncbi:MAG: cytochrome c oxidase subunit II [Chloroflexi bacterium]|nr:cytochrome c oxidase subunit II [Chloroflexota bacterium]MCC6896494.1 cytochrome c oxidase subunit II [Anaerolineae bacterium]
MKLSRKRSRLLLLVLCVVLLAACQGESSILDPSGEGAMHIANLWWVMLIIAAVVYVQVISFLLLALFRRRNADGGGQLPDTGPPSKHARTFIVVNGIAIPIAILTFVFGFNLLTLVQLSPVNANAQLTIEVIGHRWWWEVRYPTHNIVTANEIYIPTDTQVELHLTSSDVIHSLWIPKLNGKTDLIPGQTNRMFLRTSEVGEYRGQCAELCGIQHARMQLFVVAQSPSDFEHWIEGQQQEAPAPADDMALRGQQIFLGAACVYCHTVRGTSASGVIGPDLTHLASRKTLGAGVVLNTPGNLAGWIIDSQSIKPGNLMPPIYLESDDLQALLTYLATLQ